MCHIGSLQWNPIMGNRLRILILLSTSALIGAVLFEFRRAFFPIRAEAPITLKLTPEAVDFREVMQGEVPTATVLVQNPTKQSWRLERVQVSCGACTTAKVVGDILPPNGSLQAEITYSSREQHGQMNHSVTLLFRSMDNEADRKVVVVPVSANVHARVESDTRELIYGEVPLANRVERIIRFRFAPECSPVKPPSIVGSAGEFSLVAESKTENGEVAVRLLFAPIKKAGPRYGSLLLDTGVPNYPPWKMVYSASVVGSFSANPVAVHWGLVSSPSAERAVLLESKGGPKDRILRVVQLPSFLTARLEEFGSKQRLVLKLKTAELRPQQVFQGLIRLEANSMIEQFVEIPVDGLTPPSELGARP